MSESKRVQRWRNAKRQQGLEPLTIWLSHEDKARLLDMAQQWHQSPSEMIREALAQFNPVSPHVTATETDTEQLRALIRDELAASPLVTATATDAVTATLAQELPALVRQIVEELALEAMGLPITATYSDITDTEASEEKPAQRKAGRSRETMRQRILALLADHPEGLHAEEIRAYLRPERPLGDTLQGMRRQRVVNTRGQGREMVYFLP
jgi:hypothetical protein